MNILNLTQHNTTAEQAADGVFEPGNKKLIQDALLFEAIPTRAELFQRARLLAIIAMEHECKSAMIGGAPFFMSILELSLVQVGIQPLYAFSTRESVEETLPDGSVRKTNIFRHAGFVPAR